METATVDDSSTLPEATPPSHETAPAEEPLAAETLAALRRFHHGDRRAAVEPLPAGTMPAALARLSAESGDGGWPVDLGPEAGAEPVAYGPRAHVELAMAAARRALARARAAYAAEATRLAGLADAQLEADKARDPGAVSAAEQGERLGALGARFVDPARLAGVVAHRKAGRPMGPERRARLAAARDTLAGFAATRAEPVLAGAATAADACTAAAAAFDLAAAEVTGFARAARVVRLESADAFDAERHLPALDRLDWTGFTREELALVAPVVVDLGDAFARPAALQAISRLLLSGRPVQLVATVSDLGPDGDGAVARLEPLLLGIAHRVVFVHQGSVARAVALAVGFGRAFSAGTAGLHLVDVPAIGVGHTDRVSVAAARIAARAVPLVRYAPDEGPNWARRIQLEQNPDVATDWAIQPLPPAAGVPAEAPVTFADAALLDPAWRGHFAAAAGSAPELTPLAEWLGLAPEEAAHRLPFVWGLADQRYLRLVVERRLAAVTRDRLAFWRSLQELAGVRNEMVDALAARGAAERAELEKRHAAELEKARAEAAAAAVERVVSALVEAEPALAAAGVVAGGAAPAAAAAVTPAPPVPTVAEAKPEVEDAWVDTAACTSCDECVRKQPAIFAYDGNKQAFVKNPRGGPFKAIVQAAEACTARVIHPGKPWDPNEAGLAVWVERAKRFQ